MRSQTAYAEFVQQAERAVSGVKDAELRRVAFERVLDDMLSSGKSDASEEPSAEAKRTRSHPRNKATAVPFPEKRGGPQAYVEELASDGFFKKQKTISEVKVELGSRGHHVALTSLSGPLQKLCQKKILRRQKIDGAGGKKTFGYSNW